MVLFYATLAKIAIAVFQFISMGELVSSSFIMQAINLYDSIQIKGMRNVLGGKVINSSPQQLELQYGENSYLFIYRFGCIVFFNMQNELLERELQKIKSVLGNGVPHPTTENFQINVGDFATKVEFEYVELKKVTLDLLRLIATTVGQSAALEYFEMHAERLLQDTGAFMHRLAKVGSVPINPKVLLKFIGTAASNRQQIISNLSILDPPEDTWKSKELEKFFKEIQQNFDIDVRFRTLDRKLSLVQDNIEILADLTASRRSTFLEFLIVILIVLELIFAVTQRLSH